MSLPSNRSFARDLSTSLNRGLAGHQLSVLMVASEAVPFAKTGGLADVSSSLATALGRLGHEVTLVTPRYRVTGSVGTPIARSSLSLGGRSYDVGFAEQTLGVRTRAVLVECDELFDRDGLYGLAGSDYADNATRFALLARAALELVTRGEVCPSVVHAHDWQAGLVPVYARTLYARHPRFESLVTVFTIHNIAYQGLFSPDVLPGLDLGLDVYTVDGLEFWKQVSFLKAGINFSDLVTTVSERYAREILTQEFGFGFEGIMRARRHHLRGILNGIDVEEWNPERDRCLPKPFSARDLEGKQGAKRKLLEEFGLPVSEATLQTPVIGMISRLVYQKGFDLIEQAIDRLPELGAIFVVLGTGESQYEAMWQAAAARYPQAIRVRIGYDEVLSHVIEAGADMFLMPSRYEPCGLNQMYSMRYGTVPIVRSTGGLDDAVEEYDKRTGRGTGFKFHDYTSMSMLAALRDALRVFKDADRWREMQLAGMKRDHSWAVSASAYIREYIQLIQRRRQELIGDS